MSRKLLAILAVAAALVLCSCSGASSAANSRAAERQSANRKPAPNFTLTDANGQSVKLSDYRGKVVLLNFWATWCGPCQIEIPWFIEFEQQFKSKGFEVVGVSMDDDGWKVVKPYIATHKLNYRVLLGDETVSQLYGGLDALPTTFMIDREGTFAFSPHIGLAGKNEYLSEIESLLGSAKGADARRQTAEELLKSSGGALRAATVLGEFLEKQGASAERRVRFMPASVLPRAAE